MNLRTTLAAALGAVGLAAAAAYAPAAHADRVGFNVTIGGPGYAFNIGNYGYGYGYYAPPPVVAPYVPYYRSYYAPAPVVVRPYPVWRPHYDRHDHRHRHHDQRRYRDHDRGRYYDR
jgi:hypothetical protein